MLFSFYLATDLVVSSHGLWTDTVASNPGNLEKGKEDEKADPSFKPT